MHAPLSWELIIDMIETRAPNPKREPYKKESEVIRDGFHR